MDNTGSDKFALEAFNLAFAIQRIFQSRLMPSEAKERLFHDLSKLKEQVGLLTKISENQEITREKQRGRTGGLTYNNKLLFKD
jgi:hypothetical protein